MFRMDLSSARLVGPNGSLPVPVSDEITRKLAMLIEGECALGPLQAAAKYDYSKQRYFQLRQLFFQLGALGLQGHKRGPKSNYRRTEAVIRQIIRYRFLDPDMSAAVIAQKLRQLDHPVSTSSVERVIAAYGLQKKTLCAADYSCEHRVSSHKTQGADRAQRPS